jgi:hypothetical protein
MELMNAETQVPVKDSSSIKLSSHTKSHVMKDIKEFRTQLVSMIRPGGDALSGYKINKSQDQLFVILNETRLYQNGKYADDRVRSFARYFFERVANKSRDVIAQSIIMEDCNDSSTDQIIKGEKKLGNKNKRKRRNRNKNQNKEQSQDQKENTNKQLSPSKDEANENGPDKDVSKPEEEKKLVDENFSPIKDA